MLKRLLPDNIEFYSDEKLSNFFKMFKENYMIDNVELIDNFF